MQIAYTCWKVVIE